MSEITIGIDDGVLTIIFNRPAYKNALTAEMYRIVTKAINAAVEDPDVRVCVLRGNDSVFTAGNDIRDFLTHPPTADDGPAFAFLRALAEFPKPMVAQVCGPAVGVGTTLLFHCDFVYAADNATFSMPFVNLGLCPEAGSSLLGPLMLGYLRAAEMLLLGEAISAADARAHGLVTRVLPVAELSPYAENQVRKLAEKPLSSLVETKRLMKAGQRLAVARQMAEEEAAFIWMLSEPAAREALGAFLEKRRPDFRCQSSNA
ncbi:enoyl-CoA hydratase [Pandoraea bronchicola]|uniref:Enoyl-CoA hydratase n=1 Tax=Pandoraea bronchicola TaxID=2508287 RepID=A0A5E5BXU6_9BURK|nr:enoyl-CoA hydratase [Pandoraea bronchicola]VVE89835.1 enoyl-CoA hydratase [Pandoraea bronchicola]